MDSAAAATSRGKVRVKPGLTVDIEKANQFSQFSEEKRNKTLSCENCGKSDSKIMNCQSCRKVHGDSAKAGKGIKK